MRRGSNGFTLFLSPYQSLVRVRAWRVSGWSDNCFNFVSHLYQVRVGDRQRGMERAREMIYGSTSLTRQCRASHYSVRRNVLLLLLHPVYQTEYHCEKDEQHSESSERYSPEPITTTEEGSSFFKLTQHWKQSGSGDLGLRLAICLQSFQIKFRRKLKGRDSKKKSSPLFTSLGHLINDRDEGING